MDVDYYDLEDMDLLSSLCPKCLHRQYYVYDRHERHLELQCNNCGYMWDPNKDEEDENLDDMEHGD